MRCFLVLDIDCQSCGTSGCCQHCDPRELASAHVKTILDVGTGAATPNEHCIAFVLLEKLRALPFRIVEIFGKPENAQDVFAVLSATGYMLECCDISLASSERKVALQGMAASLSRVPDHFNQMVSHLDPAALVVLAHWAALLVKQAKGCGCWFLDGLANDITLQIADQSILRNHAALDLVLGLAGRASGV